MKVTNLVSRGSVLATTHALYNSSKSHLGASSSGVRITKKSIGRKHLALSLKPFEFRARVLVKWNVYTREEA